MYTTESATGYSLLVNSAIVREKAWDRGSLVLQGLGNDRYTCTVQVQYGRFLRCSFRKLRPQNFPQYSIYCCTLPAIFSNLKEFSSHMFASCPCVKLRLHNAKDHTRYRVGRDTEVASSFKGSFLTTGYVGCRSSLPSSHRVIVSLGSVHAIRGGDGRCSAHVKCGHRILTES